MRTERIPSLLLVALLAHVAGVASLLRAETLDALVATVGRTVITLSQVRLVRDLRMVAATGSEAAVLEELINRTLMLAEVDRFQPPEPPTSRLDGALATLRQSVGTDGWQHALTRAGIDEAYVRAMVGDSLRLEAYLRQRFDALAEPADEDIRSAYDQRQREGSGLPSFEILRPQLRDQLARERFRRLVDQWIAELRSRGEVSVRGVLASPP